MSLEEISQYPSLKDHKNGTVRSMRKSLPLAIPVLHTAKFCSPSNPGLFPSSISEIELYRRFWNYFTQIALCNKDDAFQEIELISLKLHILVTSLKLIWFFFKKIHICTYCKKHISQNSLCPHDKKKMPILQAQAVKTSAKHMKNSSLIIRPSQRHWGKLLKA